MNEKKLTDEEIVTALECCVKNDCRQCPIGHDDCRENAAHKMFFDLVSRQKAEIERLTEENGNISQSYIEVCDINAELQKQVDELTDKLGKVLLGIDIDEMLVAKGVERAVKDTAKEIYDWLKEHLAPTPSGLCIFKTYLKERYGVEVEE